MPGIDAQPMKGVGVVDLGGPRQVQLQVADLCVEVVDQGQVDGDIVPHAGIGEAFGDVQAWRLPA